MNTGKERPRWLLTAFVVAMLEVPLLAQLYRIVTDYYTPFGWMMYS